MYDHIATYKPIGPLRLYNNFQAIVVSCLFLDQGQILFDPKLFGDESQEGGGWHRLAWWGPGGSWIFMFRVWSLDGFSPRWFLAANASSLVYGWCPSTDSAKVKVCRTAGGAKGRRPKAVHSGDFALLSSLRPQMMNSLQLAKQVCANPVFQIFQRHHTVRRFSTRDL